MRKLDSSVLVLVGIVIGACVQQVAPTFFAQAASARHCDYTYIVDTGTPEIGEGGAVTYDDDWKNVLSERFVLKLSTGSIYVFERCE